MNTIMTVGRAVFLSDNHGCGCKFNDCRSMLIGPFEGWNIKTKERHIATLDKITGRNRTERKKTLPNIFLFRNRANKNPSKSWKIVENITYENVTLMEFQKLGSLTTEM